MQTLIYVMQYDISVGESVADVPPGETSLVTRSKELWLYSQTSV